MSQQGHLPYQEEGQAGQGQGQCTRKVRPRSEKKVAVGVSDWYMILIEYEGFGNFLSEQFNHI